MIEEFLKKANSLFENKEYEEVLKLIKNYPENNHPSILYYFALGLPDWIVHDKNDYIKTLKKLANLKKIYKLRLKLRRQVVDSPLCNGLRFAKNFENAMEKIFCE